MRRLFLMMSIPLATGLAGCSNTHYATFVTKTSLAVADVDTSPGEASIAFTRREGYIGPRFDDGKAYPVVGFIDARGSALNRQTVQVFAGGHAALHVIRPDGNELSEKQNTACPKDETPPLYFSTSTSLGLRASMAEGSTIPVSFNLGYRRKEAAMVPVSKDCFPSVIATHDSDGGARDGDVNMGIVQYIATGEAADLLAQRTEARALFTRGLNDAGAATKAKPAASAPAAAASAASAAP